MISAARSSSRCSGVDYGLLLHRYDAPRRCHRCVRYVLRILRLHETGRTYGSLDAGTSEFIWTHDAFRVGEDGPTHEPVEQEAQIRLMEKLKNHHGQNSLLVLRPADAEETTVCWKLAMENTDTPSALILSRQNIEMLPEGNDYGQAAKGAYIVAGSDENPDVIPRRFRFRSIHTRGRCRPAACRRHESTHRELPVRRLVPQSVPVLSGRDSACRRQDIRPHRRSARQPQGLVGANGKVFGLESFGFSAPTRCLMKNSASRRRTCTTKSKKCSDDGSEDCRSSLRPRRIRTQAVREGIPRRKKGYAYKDFGTDSEASCDYADYAHLLAQAVEDGECYPGIAICGSGEGISMTLNKHQGIRAGLSWIPEIAHLCRQHNDANVLVMPGRFIDTDMARKIMDEFFATDFEGGRHQRRIDKMPVK